MRPVFALFNPITLMRSLLLLHVLQVLPHLGMVRNTARTVISKDIFCLNAQPSNVGIVTRLVTLSTTALPSLPSQVNQAFFQGLLITSVAVAAEDSPSDLSLLSVPVSELGPLVFTMVKQFLSSSDKVSSAVSGNTWYFDSTCCNHMPTDSQLFSSVIPTTHAPLIQTANGSHIAASHTGSVSTSYTISI
jgi:hypothetical protein